MTRNAVSRERVRAGRVECPICRRQIAEPADQLVVYGAAADPSAETADAIECPACEGVTFLVDGPPESD